MNITWTKSKKQCVKLSRPIVIDIGSAPQRRTNSNGTTTTKHIWVEIRVFGYGLILTIMEMKGNLNSIVLINVTQCHSSIIGVLK